MLISGIPSGHRPDISNIFIREFGLFLANQTILRSAATGFPVRLRNQNGAHLLISKHKEFTGDER